LFRRLDHVEAEPSRGRCPAAGAPEYDQKCQNDLDAPRGALALGMSAVGGSGAATRSIVVRLVVTDK
jgi:hypothetical protein